ncbi:hemerythrin domain-containing protein [Salinimicrobium sp. CDJ15-81-2]|nr:hemerythrin domain-containing protein [Salinimicrobium nanhaiense]
MTNPIVRHDALKPLSRDHHHGLLLCWKIREGIKKQVAPGRIKDYTDYFFTSQLRPHFRFEEREIFPLLGDHHPMMERAVNEHRRLESLFKEEASVEVFSAIETELNRHIRFEERELFQELQKTASKEALQNIRNKEEEVRTPDPEDWDDKFWLKEGS